MRMPGDKRPVKALGTPTTLCIVSGPFDDCIRMMKGCRPRCWSAGCSSPDFQMCGGHASGTRILDTFFSTRSLPDTESRKPDRRCQGSLQIHCRLHLQCHRAGEDWRDCEKATCAMCVQDVSDSCSGLIPRPAEMFRLCLEVLASTSMKC